MPEVDKIWSGLYREWNTGDSFGREGLAVMVCGLCCAVVPAHLIVAHNNWHADD